MAASEAGVEEPPHPGVLVRRVTELEWPSVRHLRLRALAADPLAFGSHAARESTWGDSNWVDWIREGASSPTTALWVAAQDDGSLVGMGGVYPQEDGPHVRGMWVEPALRGRGIGGEMLDALLAWRPPRRLTVALPSTTYDVVIGDGLLRRAGIARSRSDTQLVVGDLSMDEDAREVRRGDELIELTATEFELLRFLMRNPRRVLSKAQILDRVWNYDFGGQAHVVELYISYLRKKIDAGREPLIHTVRGVGYVLKPTS